MENQRRFLLFAKILVVIFALPLWALAQTEDLTLEERWASDLAVYHSTEWLAWAYKSPIEAELPAVELPALPQITRAAVLGRIVDADANPAWGTPVGLGGLPVARLATFNKPMRIAAVTRQPGELGSSTGTTVTFSSQGDAALRAQTGKGLTDFQLIVGTMCRWTPGPSFSFGLVTQLANSIGIQTISKGASSAIVQHRVDLNWHNLWPFLIKEGSLTALSFMTSGLWNPGRAAIFATVIVHESGDHLPALFGRGAPNPDPYLNNATASTDKIDLVPGECKEAQFSGVYAGPKTSFVTDRLQLLP